MRYNTISLIMTFLIVGLISFSGCKKDDEDIIDPNIIKENTENGNIAKAVLGRGYNICGHFADSEDIREAVLNFSTLSGDNKIIKDGNIAETQAKVHEGETYEEYELSINYARTASGGIDGLFSAETGANFGYGRVYESGCSFATVSSFTYKYGMYIDGRLSPTSLTSYVNEQFLSDAESMSTEDLIEAYGTHVIVGGKWGASFEYTMSAKRKSVSNEYSFGAFVQAEATIEGITLGGSQSIDVSFSDYYETSSKKRVFNLKGGNSEHVVTIINAETPEARDAAYTAWVESIENNPAFCDYYQDGLVPIFEFIEDETLKSKVKEGIENYMAENDIESYKPISGKITDEFHVANFCQRVAGDGDIDADGGGDIYVEVKFTLSEEFGSNSNNLELKIDMKVHEMKGDYTKIEGTTYVSIINNRELYSIDVENPVYSFNIEGRFNPAGGEYWAPPLPANLNQSPWLSNIEICIDGKGDDEKYIGVKGTVSADVSFVP